MVEGYRLKIDRGDLRKVCILGLERRGVWTFWIERGRRF